MQFAGILFYDGQGFMVPAGSGVKTVAQLSGATICVERGTTHERNMADHFIAHGMSITPLVIDSVSEVANAFFSGRCKAYTSDISQLGVARLRAPAGQTSRHPPGTHLERTARGPLCVAATTTG